MKSENELISIGMPVYNGEEYLEEAIKSILSQTYTHLELIISDDCSTDESPKIYENYAKKDKRIIIFHHTKNIGSIPNFNFVLERAKGKYFVWASQDDLRSKHALKKLLFLHRKNPDAVLAVSHYQNLYNNKTYDVYPKMLIDNTHSRLQSIIIFLKNNNLSFFYGMHKTKILQNSGGYRTDSRPFFKGSDYLTILKVLLHGKFIYTPETLFYKRDTGLYTKQYNVIQEMHLNSVIIHKIVRYLCFPLFYLYDFIYGFYFVLQHEFPLWEKCIIEWYLFTNSINRFFQYIKSVLIGINYFLRGLYNRLFLYVNK